MIWTWVSYLDNSLKQVNFVLRDTVNWVLLLQLLKLLLLQGSNSRQEPEEWKFVHIQKISYTWDMKVC